MLSGVDPTASGRRCLISLSVQLNGPRGKAQHSGRRQTTGPSPARILSLYTSPRCSRMSKQARAIAELHVTPGPDSCARRIIRHRCVYLRRVYNMLV